MLAVANVPSLFALFFFFKKSLLTVHESKASEKRRIAKWQPNSDCKKESVDVDTMSRRGKKCGDLQSGETKRRNAMEPYIEGTSTEKWGKRKKSRKGSCMGESAMTGEVEELELNRGAS